MSSNNISFNINKKPWRLIFLLISFVDSLRLKFIRLVNHGVFTTCLQYVLLHFIVPSRQIRCTKTAERIQWKRTFCFLIVRRKNEFRKFFENKTGSFSFILIRYKTFILFLDLLPIRYFQYCIIFFRAQRRYHHLLPMNLT